MSSSGLNANAGIQMMNMRQGGKTFPEGSLHKEGRGG